MKIAIYPGSFDPITNGHLDIITQASQIFDQVIVAVADNRQKKHLFTLAQRLEHLQKILARMHTVRVDSFSGLLVKYAQAQQASILLRGLRNSTDFEYEFQLAHMNKSLAPDIHSLFISSAPEYAFISSTLVKEAASLGADVSALVPALINEQLQEKYR